MDAIKEDIATIVKKEIIVRKKKKTLKGRFL